MLFSVVCLVSIFIYIYQTVLIVGQFILFWLVLISIFIQIMFFTTCERKALSLIQRRMGPCVVGIRGRLQYIADSLKLLTKVFVGPRHINAGMFQGAAFGGFWISWFSFGNLTYSAGLDVIEFEYNIFFLVCFSLLFSIIILVSGWASMSRYAMLGSLRAAVQFISFEVIMSIIFLVILFVFNTFNYEAFVDLQLYVPLILFIPLCAVFLFLAFLMEINRPPFDLSEAESDVVAGYNVEYSGILFGLFYLGEYLNLFIACTMIIVIFCGGWLSPLSYMYTFIINIYNIL